MLERAWQFSFVGHVLLTCPVGPFPLPVHECLCVYLSVWLFMSVFRTRSVWFSCSGYGRSLTARGCWAWVSSVWFLTLARSSLQFLLPVCFNWRCVDRVSSSTSHSSFYTVLNLFKLFIFFIFFECATFSCAVSALVALTSLCVTVSRRRPLLDAFPLSLSLLHSTHSPFSRLFNLRLILSLGVIFVVLIE